MYLRIKKKIKINYTRVQPDYLKGSSQHNCILNPKFAMTLCVNIQYYNKIVVQNYFLILHCRHNDVRHDLSLIKS